MKLHLVDATFELFRAYHGRPAEHRSDGRTVHGVHGLIDSMLSLLAEADVTHVGAATDHVIESWRNDLYGAYKSSAGVPPDLLAQFPLAERALQALGMVTWPMVEDEADDALATAVARWADDPRVEQVVICSVDKDLAQCVRGDHVVLRDRMRRITYDEAGVRAKLGVPPSSVPDYLSLVGDASDGYPGLPGWGAKSAARVLERFGHLEEIPDSSAEWGLPLRNAPTLAATLRERRDEVLLYRTLARLRTDVPLPQGLEELEWRGVLRDRFRALCEELGFTRLAARELPWAAA